MNTAAVDQEHITIPLPPEAHEWAQKFAAAQDNPEKGKRIYLITLAVYAVNRYLRWLQVETDLEGSYSWNIATNSSFDIADLDLPKIGSLICCPVLPDEESFTPPEMLPPNAIGYIAVQFKEVLNEVDLVGYRPILNPSEPKEELDLDILEAGDSDDGYSLFPIGNLLDWLFYVEDVREQLETSNEPLIEGIRQMFEEQFSASQLAVKAIHNVQTVPENLFPNRGKEILTSKETSGNAVLQKSTVLRNFFDRSQQGDVEITEDEAERELEQIGGEFLQWVKQIINP